MFSLNQSKVQYLVIIELLLNQQEKKSVGGTSVNQTISFDTVLKSACTYSTK